MFKLLTLVACFTLALAKDNDSEWEKPSFCNENDCPIYSVLAAEKDYELRRYQPAKWVSTVVYATTVEEADEQLGQAFNKLFNYIDGQNANNEKIDMTTPVTTLVEPATSPEGPTKFTRSFYLPYSRQEDAPEPTGEGVFLVDEPEMEVYVGLNGFTDFATIQDHMDNIQKLAEQVGDDSKYEQDIFYMNGYDSPFKWWNRHNEGWLVAKSSSKKH